MGFEEVFYIATLARVWGSLLKVKKWVIPRVVETGMLFVTSIVEEELAQLDNKHNVGCLIHLV